MQIVIDIPKEYYDEILTLGMDSSHLAPIYRALINSVPLPKGHGRILDEKDILDIENNDGGWYDLVDMPEYIAGIKAIIEEDKESEEV